MGIERVIGNLFTFVYGLVLCAIAAVCYGYVFMALGLGIFAALVGGFAVAAVERRKGGRRGH